MQLLPIRLRIQPTKSEHTGNVRCTIHNMFPTDELQLPVTSTNPATPQQQSSSTRQPIHPSIKRSLQFDERPEASQKQKQVTDKQVAQDSTLAQQAPTEASTHHQPKMQDGTTMITQVQTTKEVINANKQGPVSHDTTYGTKGKDVTPALNKQQLMNQQRSTKGIVIQEPSEHAPAP